MLLLALLAACKPAAPNSQKGTATAGPQVHATVVTIRTTVQPAKRVTTHTIVIAGNLARSLDERDVWRLFDTKSGEVKFVDDVAKTVRSESAKELAEKHRAALSGALPATYPRIQVTRSGARHALLGTTAEEMVLQAGSYRRELWVATHRMIPPALFAMMTIADIPSTPLAPILRASDEAMMTLRGFPLVDHSEVPLATSKIVVDRVVVSVQEHDVPQSLLQVPKGYLDMTAPKKK